MENLIKNVCNDLHHIESAKIPNLIKKQVTDEVFDSILKVKKSNREFVLMYKSRQIDLIKLKEFQAVLKIHLDKINNLIDYVKKELI